MSQTTALIFAIILYGLLPIGGLFLGYLGYKKLTKPKMLEYESMPELGYIPEKSLPEDIKLRLKNLNTKGQKLRLLYGDTNKDGVIDDKDAIHETYVMINKLLDEHIPEAISDYRALYDLGENITNETSIGHSGVTGKQALLDILKMVNSQFDELLEAAYHQDGQKLLITNRYLKQRFETHNL